MTFATLLYIKNSKDEYLLLERVKEPNKGFLSPPGGKIKINEAESPVACAVREAFEECRIRSFSIDWKLLGIVTEKDYPNIGDIMIFCYEYTKPLDIIPENSIEGRFSFIPQDRISESNIPETDKLYIWNFVLKSKNNLFSVHIDCSDGQYKCIVEQD